MPKEEQNCETERNGERLKETVGLEEEKSVREKGGQGKARKGRKTKRERQRGEEDAAG